MVESDLDEEDIDKAFDNYRRTNNIQTTQVKFCHKRCIMGEEKSSEFPYYSMAA